MKPSFIKTKLAFIDCIGWLASLLLDHSNFSINKTELIY